MSTTSDVSAGMRGEGRWSGRTALLLGAVAAGVALALVSSRVSALDISSFADLQKLLTSNPSSAGSIAAIGLAFVVGASMVVLPCGFPSVFMVPSILKSRRGLGQKAVLGALFLAGSAALLALAGLALSYVGDGILGLLSAQKAKMITSAVLYGLMGLMTLGYALSSLGYLRLPTPQARVSGPQLPQQDRPYRRSFVLGATFGGGMGIESHSPPSHISKMVLSTVQLGPPDLTKSRTFTLRFKLAVKPESTEGRPWGQPLKKPAGAPLNLG